MARLRGLSVLLVLVAVAAFDTRQGAAQQRDGAASDDVATLDKATTESAHHRVAPIEVDDFDRLLAAIKPQQGESPWRDVPWLTNITEARRRALAEDKPLVIFTAADGSPLGRT
jgi:hypothetical protein